MNASSKQLDEKRMVVQCCICGHTRNGEHWAAAAPEDSAEFVSHTYCPRCMADSKVRRFLLGDTGRFRKQPATSA